METNSKPRSDADIKAILLGAACALQARYGNEKFPLTVLCREAGVSRGAFYRSFSGKPLLIAAMAQRNAPILSETAMPLAPNGESQRAAEDPPAGRPRVDAWLERRLRVFERALTSLEERQEKAERRWSRDFARLEAMAPSAVPAQCGETRAVENAIDPQAAAEQTEEITPAQKIDDKDPARDITEPEEPEEPISDMEIEDFIAHARRTARQADAPPVEPPRKALPRWIAWFALGLVILSASLGFLLPAGLALGHVLGPAMASPSAGQTHRYLARNGLPRVVAMADGGNARAQTLLALAFLRGGNGAGDAAAARRWGLAAAEQGEPVAEYLLGTLYGDGIGGARDARRAVGWYRAAAAQGNLKAMHNLAIAYAQGSGVTKDAATAAAWFASAAVDGYVDSQFDLAVLYERGSGVAQNETSALAWYLIAARSGDAVAAKRADQLRVQMTQAQIIRASERAASFAPRVGDPRANAVAPL